MSRSPRPPACRSTSATLTRPGSAAATRTPRTPRQYLPKGTDLSFYGPGMLDNIAAQLNGRPRKTLSWRTPAEALQALLSGQPDPPDVATTA